MDVRQQHLDQFAMSLYKSAALGHFGKTINVKAMHTITGPRAGAIEIQAGFDSGVLLSALQKNDCAVLRQYIPWDFPGKPNCFMSSRYVRVEAGWSESLAESLIRLAEINQRPQNDGRWCVGKNEYGQSINLQLNDNSPHYLVSGSTGSGKSVSMRNAALQLGQDPDNQLVLLDGKYGDSLNVATCLPSVIGPIATEIDQQRAALGWVATTMRKRYQTGDKPGRIIALFDEFQESVTDDVVVALLGKIAAQGRGANVHLIAATHHPTVDAFGERRTRRLFVGKLALYVDDYDSSRVAVGGSTPRADFLLGKGDSYVVVPQAIHRVQVAYVDEKDFDKASYKDWLFDEWPEYSAYDVGQELPTREPQYTETEIANAIISAIPDKNGKQEGRPAFKNRFACPPGSDRARRLLTFGRDVWQSISISKRLTDWISTHST